ncbi:MAG TPA: hypothetical protein VMM35_02020 [Longimicrobiales bacterium]|nr:hypothetical protein [Longimicrobiales bacterium]
MWTPLPAAVLATSLLLSACGQRRLEVVAPIPDAQGAAAELRDGTHLEEPLHIVFAWQLNEAGRRLHGRGVARVEPPYKARIDLFLHNNETVVRAALVDGDLRLPAGAPDDILPPPDLMWGVLGVFRPPEGTELLGAERLEGNAMRLRYAYPDRTELHYEVVDGSVRMLELLERGQVVQRVRLEPGTADGYPKEAVYRNMADFRELSLERESLEVVPPFDTEIWDPRS